MSEARRPNGVILYRGPSLLDGRPIVCIATGLRAASQNEKTGEMVQTYVLCRRGALAGQGHPRRPRRQRVRRLPHAGGLRPPDGRLPQGRSPATSTRARGPRRSTAPCCGAPTPPTSGRLHRALFAGRSVRFGTYGDPAAVPVRVAAPGGPGVGADRLHAPVADRAAAPCGAS